MRAAFGLVSLLIAVFIIVWLMSDQLDPAQPTQQATQQARQQAAQFGGYAADQSMTFRESLNIDMDTSGGRPRGIIVTSVVTGGPAETQYGLARGDTIVQIGPMRVRDYQWDADAAMDFLMQEGYSRNRELVVLRGGQEVTLTPGALGGRGDGPTASPTAGGTGADSPSTPGNALERQLQGIQVPSH
jgi:hypothetical protein